MDPAALITSSTRAIGGLAPAVANLEALEQERADAERAVARGHFAPEEEHRVRAWFARYLTARAGLLETIDDLRPIAWNHAGVKDRSCGEISAEDQLRAFVLGYTAAALLVRTARFLVDEFATHKLVQRKLNEACEPHRIPRKQYTYVYRALTKPLNAWRLREAMHFADAHRAEIEQLAADPSFAPILTYLGETEDAMRVGVRRYVKARLRYRWHSYRRRRASAAQSGLFRISEAFGRVIAEMRSPWHRDRVTAAVREQLVARLRPGDVIVCRHDDALSNLFLPGYWPHSALHIGLPEAREAMGVDVPEPQAERWIDPLCVLEARKDGVLFRALDDTLAVDSVAIIRPRLVPEDLARALANAVKHEGKLYNFDFDFFNDDRLVCTEVVYRAFEGVGGIRFTLGERAGRQTLTAEDVLDMAIDGRGFEVVAVFGVPGCPRRIVDGDEAFDVLMQSYRAT